VREPRPRVGAADGLYPSQIKLSVGIPTLDASRAAASSSGRGLEKRRETVDKAHALGLKVYEGKLHYNVDNSEDLTLLKEELAANLGAASSTAEFLRSL
jgi:hypothetical protein